MAIHGTHVDARHDARSIHRGRSRSVVRGACAGRALGVPRAVAFRGFAPDAGEPVNGVTIRGVTTSGGAAIGVVTDVVAFGGVIGGAAIGVVSGVTIGSGTATSGLVPSETTVGIVTGG